MYDQGFDAPHRRQRVSEHSRVTHYPRPMTWLHRLIGRTPPCVRGAAWPCPDAIRA